MPRSAPNPVWNYFEDSDDKQAKCKICENKYSYASTSYNLKRHLQQKHSIVIWDSDASDSDSPLKTKYSENNSNSGNILIVTKKRKNSSLLWTAFKKLSNDKATCNTCGDTFSFKTSTGNLWMHLKRRHADVLDNIRKDATNEDLSYTIDDVNEDSNSSVQQQDVYFEEFEGRIKCTVCNTNITLAGEDPRAHLEEHHPALLAKIIKDEDRAEDAQNEEKDIFTEVVYLDSISDKRSDKKKTTNISLEKTRKRKLSESSDEYLIKEKPKPMSEIDGFTKYITILLKNLPKDVSTRLQLEIINLILKAQLDLPSAASTKTGENTPSTNT